MLMMLASVAVVQKAVEELVKNWGSANGPAMDFDTSSAIVLLVVILLKIGLWRWGARAAETENNVSLEAISQDNYNDVLSNIAALAAAMLAKANKALWPSDPFGAIAISLYIIYNWFKTAFEQVD